MQKLEGGGVKEQKGEGKGKQMAGGEGGGHGGQTLGLQGGGLGGGYLS